jgi:hypothetical protein
MTNRRNFLKTTALATAGVAFQAFNGKSEETEIDINSGKVRINQLYFQHGILVCKPMKPLGKYLKIKVAL